MKPKRPISDLSPNPPGKLIKELAARSRVADSVLSHTHVLQIIDDHQMLWFEATSKQERHAVRRRMYKQLGWAAVSFLGFEVSIHGGVLAIIDPVRGGSMFVLGIAIMYFISKKG